MMTFSEALVYLKAGKRVCRGGWNGKNLYVEKGYYPAGVLSNDDFSGDMLMKDFFVIKDLDRREVNTWVPSVSDLLSDDWRLCE